MNINLGKKIRQLRKGKNLSQEVLRRFWVSAFRQ